MMADTMFASGDDVCLSTFNHGSEGNFTNDLRPHWQIQQFILHDIKRSLAGEKCTPAQLPTKLNSSQRHFGLEFTMVDNLNEDLLRIMREETSSKSDELAVTSIASSNLSSVSLLTGTITKPQRTIRSCASRTTARGTCFIAGRTTTPAGW
jgi:hypothetical protein